MKTTGIIRRIDELGRIVIPKELRKNLKIGNGDSLEILLDGEDIVLKKYSPMESLETVANKYAESFYAVIKHSIIITDKSKVIAASGGLKKKYLDMDISEFTERSIERRDSFAQRQKREFEIVNGVTDFGYYACSSIVNNTDAIGSVIIISTDNIITDAEEKMASILSKLLSKHFID